jgi:hypothetical protein
MYQFLKVYSYALQKDIESYPNKLKNPNNSIRMPNTGILRKTSKTPAKKQIDPRILFFRAKKAIVFEKPIRRVTPDRNKIYQQKKCLVY